MTSKNCWQYILAREPERGRLSRQMSLPNGGLSDWDRVTMASKAASATKCANYRNAITKDDATLPPRKNNKAKLLSDESSSSGSNNGANNNVTTMWQLLPIFSNKESEKEAKNNKEKINQSRSCPKNKKMMCWWHKTRTTDSRYASWETWQQFAVPCVCAGEGAVWRYDSNQPRPHSTACGKAIGKHSTTEIELK